MNYYNVQCYRESAEKKMNRESWDYLEGGAGDESTVRKNKSIFDNYVFKNKIPLKSINNVDISTSILGKKVQSPIILGPVSPLQLFHSEGEESQVKAAFEKNTIAVCSGHSLNKIGHMGSWEGRKWFQLYSTIDMEHNYRMIDSVVNSGYEALVITIDAFHKAIRDRNLKNNFKLPEGIGFGNYPSKSYRDDGSINLLPLGWEDLQNILDYSSIPVIIKGILNSKDIEYAYKLGFSGVVISNHGGRQLDRTSTTLDVLSKLKDIPQENFDIYIDGGFMRGVDILMALTLGAKAILLGRAYVYGLTVSGSDGISDVISILEHELSNAMQQLGVASISDLHPDMITKA